MYLVLFASRLSIVSPRRRISYSSAWKDINDKKIVVQISWARGRPRQRTHKESISLPEIMEKYDEHDEAAIITVNRMLKYFGKGVASIINLIDPDVIVIGGGVGNIDLLYDEGIKQVKKYIFNHRLDTHIVKPKLGDSAGVFGAALL